MSTVFIHPSLEVRPSTRHGRGVFTRAPIARGTVIERCVALLLTPGTTELFDYRFNWPRNDRRTYAVALGFGSLYNHSDRPNVDWETRDDLDLFVFHALRDLEEDEEIVIDYGGEWWKRRSDKEKQG